LQALQRGDPYQVWLAQLDQHLIVREKQFFQH
jgi:hypothetical protein